MSLSVLSAYQERVADGTLQEDPAQAAAAAALARLEAELNARGEPAFTLPFQRRREPPRGVYLWGPVGRGKSLLMDLFFASAPVERKRRIHFDVFMGEAHGLITAWRASNGAERKALFGQTRGDDPIAPAAARLADQARLLCFDELQVSDIADAMILGRLFEALFERGVVLVATSNRAPEALYENGLNRQLFTPFVALLTSRMEVVSVAGPRDYRAGRLKGAQTYFSPLNPAAEAAFDGLWRRLLGGQAPTGGRIEVLGRVTAFPEALGGCVRVSFAALCGAALGPQDYIAFAAAFSTVFLEAAPRLGPENRNEARRFVALVDALYEARRTLVILANAEPAGLYPGGDGAFEFERTVSRLEEMRSQDWGLKTQAGAP